MLLVVQGADPNALNDTGKSPLYRACYNGHRNTVQLLLEVRHPSLYYQCLGHLTT